MGFALRELRQEHKRPSGCQGDCNRYKPGGASCTLWLPAQHHLWSRDNGRATTAAWTRRSHALGKTWSSGVLDTAQGLTLSKLSSHSLGETLGISPWDFSQLQLAPDAGQCQLLYHVQARCPHFNQIPNEAVTWVWNSILFFVPFIAHLINSC